MLAEDRHIAAARVCADVEDDPSRYRHFAIPRWIDAGLSPKTVQTVASHSSIQVTLDRYGYLFKSDAHKKAMVAIAVDMFD